MLKPLRLLGVCGALAFWWWVFTTWGLTAAYVVGGILVIGLLGMIYEAVSSNGL